MAITCLEMETRAIGNQLFEFASLFGIGNKLGYEIKIPIGKKSVHGPSGQNIIPLKDIFNITIPDLTQEDINSIKYKYIEATKDFDSGAFNIQDNTNIIGFFQSPLYFNHCWYELSKQLSFGNRWVYEAVRRFTELGVNPSECIGIHRRLGDFLRNPGVNQFHPVLPLQYYSLALSEVGKQININNSHILVFSDDIDIAKQEFSSKTIVVDNRESGDYTNVMDFVMLSMCNRTKILANSSYSYWAAKLGKVCPVFYPEVYTNYGPFNPMAEEKEWIQI